MEIFYIKKSLKIPKGAIRIRISKKNRQHNDQKKNTKGQTTINKTLHIKFYQFSFPMLEKFGDFKGIVRSRKSQWLNKG
jgi:hypothetical protein